MTQRQMTRAAQILGYNIILNSEFKGIQDIKLGLSLLDKFNADVDTTQPLSDEFLNEQVSIDLTDEEAAKMKSLINSVSVKGIQARIIADLYTAMDQSGQ